MIHDQEPIKERKQEERLQAQSNIKVLGIDWIIPVLLLDRVIESDAVPLILFQ